MSEFADKVRQLEAVLDKANQALEDALNAEKTVRVECKGCGRKQDHPVKDHGTAVRSAQVQYQVVGDLMKHLEKLRGEDPAPENPLSNLTLEELKQLRHESAERAEGTARITKRVALYDSIESVLAGGDLDQLAQAWQAYKDSDPLPAIQPVTTGHQGFRCHTPLHARTWDKLSNAQLLNMAGKAA